MSDCRVETPIAAPATGRAPRRVLVLSYFFPPDFATAAHRAGGLYRHLAEFGWQPWVLTIDRGLTQPQVITTPDTSWTHRAQGGQPATTAIGHLSQLGTRRSALRWAKNLLRHLPRFHDGYAGWSYRLLPLAIAAGRAQGVELVMATCNPFTLAPVAVQVARALGVPCVVDLQDRLPDYLLHTAPARHWFYRAIAQADALTLAGASYVTPEMCRFHTARPIQSVLFGAWHTEPQPAQPAAQFTLLHAGMLYAGERNPEPLLRALARLADELPDFRRDCRLQMIGDDSGLVAQVPGFAPVAEMVELIGGTPYAEVVARMRQASVLLIIKGADPMHDNAIPAKLYDYLPFQAPVLAVGGSSGLLGDLLRWSGMGGWAGSLDEITARIRTHYLAWKAQGIVRVPRNPDALDYLSQRRMAAEFAEVFTATVERRPVQTRDHLPWEG